MWSVDTENYFISLYKAEPVLWDPIHRICNDARAHNVAWGRISEKMGLSVPALKSLRRSLHSKFFHRLRRYQKNSQSGEKFEIYDPDWFANAPIDSFLGSIYQLRIGCKKASIKYPVKKDCAPAKENYVPEQREKNTDLMHEGHSVYPVNDDLCPLKKHRRKNPPKRIMGGSEVSDSSFKGEESSINGNSVVLDFSHKPLNPTPINHSSSSLFRPGPSIPPVYREPATNNETSEVNGQFQAAKDDCDLYATLLASKLRKLPEKDRLQIMYKIDGLLISGFIPQQNLSIKPFAPPIVQNGFPFSYPVSSEFSYLYQSVSSRRDPQYSSFSISHSR